jgi:uncharacterized membrane protein YadS
MKSHNKTNVEMKEKRTHHLNPHVVLAFLCMATFLSMYFAEVDPTSEKMLNAWENFILVLWLLYAITQMKSWNAYLDKGE